MFLTASEALDSLVDDTWFPVGHSTAAIWATRREWLFRRVETLDFVGARSVRRSVSVDFEIPKNLPPLGDRGADGATLIPISVFQKWPPLMDFSFVGPDGHPCSLYLRDTNKRLDFGLLIGSIERVLARSLAHGAALSTGLNESLAALVASDEPSNHGVARITTQLNDELTAALPEGDPTAAEEAAAAVDLAGQLAGSSILWVPVDMATPGTDRIVKFSYLGEFEAPHALWKRIFIACSWRERTIYVPLPHAGRSTRFHLDIQAPGDGLELMSARAIGFPSAAAQSTAPSSPYDEQVGPATVAPQALPSPAERGELTGESAIVDRRAHIYLGYQPGRSHRIFLELRIAAARHGFVASCLVAAVAIASLMSITFAKLGLARASLDSTVVLLAAVPVVLGYLLVRPSSHVLERYHIVGVRTMMLLCGATPILGALALVLMSPTLSTAMWAGLLILSWYFVVALFASWLFAAPRREEVRERRWPRMGPASGLFAAGAIVLGSALECQPYSHVARPALASYLRENRALILIGSALVGVGLIALYTFIGGVWRRLSIHREHRVAWRAGMVLVVGAGVLFVWASVGALTLIDWQSLTVGPASDPARVAGVIHAADTAMNLALIPMIVFMAWTSVRLLWPTNLKADPILVYAGLLLGIPMVEVRAATALTGAGGPARLAWFGFAVWLALIATALQVRITRSGWRPLLLRLPTD
jgi:hypothetical protein